MSEIEKYYNGEIIVDFEEETELEKKYNEVAELYSKAVKKKIEYRKEIERLNQYIDFYKDLTERQNKDLERLNNIINTMLDFNFFKEECPLNFGYTEKCDEEKAQDVFYEDDYCEENCNDDYKKCWLKYFERLQELKGSNNNEQ